MTRRQVATLMRGAEIHTLSAERLRARIAGVDGRAPARGDNRLKLEMKLAGKEHALVLRKASAVVRRSGALVTTAGRSLATLKGDDAPVAESRLAPVPLTLYPSEEASPAIATMLYPETFNHHLAALRFPHLAQWTVEELTVLHPPSDEITQPREDYLEFRFDQFIEQHKSVHGCPFARIYNWPNCEQTLLVYWPEPRSRLIGLELGGDVRCMQYVQILGESSKAKAAFRCPVTGERTSSLLLRSGRLASLAGQNLT